MPSNGSCNKSTVGRVGLTDVAFFFLSRKVTKMKRQFSVIAIGSVAAALMLSGCNREMKSKSVEKEVGPGGSTTTTVEKTVESSGDNPPANAHGESVPK